MNTKTVARILDEELDAKMKNIARAMKMTIRGALEVGAILNAAKKQMKRGGFGPWLQSKVTQYGLSRTTLYRWMEMDSRRQEFDFPKMGRISDAYRLLESMRARPSPAGEEEPDVPADVSPEEEATDVTQYQDSDEDTVTSDPEEDEIALFKKNADLFSGLAREVTPLLESLKTGSDRWKSCVESVRTLHGDVKSLKEALLHRSAERAIPQL